MFTINKLNSISSNVNEILTAEKYSVVNDAKNPDAILVRSYKMHGMQIGDNLLAVARAGAGTNNIPIADMTAKAVVVFNTPGANANAVKELVFGAMILASRNLEKGIAWTQELKGKGDVAKLVEDGKSNFVGQELAGKKLGVIGLGAIGALVANCGVDMGMTVYGYDPYISIDAAWTLSSSIFHEKDLNHLFKVCDYITLHVPLLDSTKETIRAETIAKMKDDVIIINCARGELVNNEDIIEALKTGKVAKYVTDFPQDSLLNIDNLVTIPHLGASTPEAENNCAAMAARQLKDYLENGNIVNSVNFPYASAPRTGVQRITIIHKNVATMIAKATSIVGDAKINIGNMLCASKGDLGYMILDIDTKAPAELVERFDSCEGFYKVRVI